MPYYQRKASCAVLSRPPAPVPKGDGEVARMIVLQQQVNNLHRFGRRTVHGVYPVRHLRDHDWCFRDKGSPAQKVNLYRMTQSVSRFEDETAAKRTNLAADRAGVPA